MARKPKQSVTPTAWRNRIVGSGTVAASQLLANPSNWRVHPKAQQDALSGALDQIGWIQDVIVNQTTGHIVDGHLRVTLALRQGDDTPVPVKYVELTDAEERLALATIDPLSAMAATDKEQLDALLRDVAPDSPALAEMLADVAKEAGLYGDKQNVDAEPQIDRAEELRAKWDVESGQLWQLGEHRLICGDCTDPAVVARVMGGEKASICLTDPPYNIGLQYKDYDDSKSIGAWRETISQWAKSISSVCQLAIITPGRQNISEWQVILRGELGAWVKSNAHGGASIAHFAKWEPILFVGKHKRNRDCDVFEFYVDNGFLNDKSAVGHVCPKPLTLWSDLLENYTEESAVVFEPFSGSGTTIMACESLNRKCRAVEISPAYVAVALERWASATGKAPVQL